MTAAVEFELWSRQNWTNLDVVGEAYRLDEISVASSRIRSGRMTGSSSESLTSGPNRRTPTTPMRSA